MGILTKIFKRSGALGDNGVRIVANNVTPIQRNDMAISAVYRCVDVISDSVAALPLILYKRVGDRMERVKRSNALAQMLNDRPEDRMSRFTLMKALVASRLLKGNGYALIDRDSTTPQLHFVDSSRVQIKVIRDNFGNPSLIYNITGYSRAFQPDEIIHVLNFTYDGLVGVSTLTHARNALQIAQGADEQVNALFECSGQPSGILSTSSIVGDAQKEQSYLAWESRIKRSKGGVVLLDRDWKYQPISINPADQQLLESREFSVVEICRFFGVNPVKCFDLSKSSYSTVEATQLSFLTDTLAPILESIEQEINRKLFLGNQAGKYEVRFDTSTLLRADKTSQANYYQKLLMCGVLTPNEVREQLGYDAVEGGDKLFMQTNMADINTIDDESRETDGDGGAI